MKEPALLEVFLNKLAFLIYGKKVYKEFADRLPIEGSEKVLDFGCGMGGVAYYALMRLEWGHVTCLDISERWLKACRKKLRRFENVSFLCAGADSLPPESYDLIFCHFVLHDISDEELEAAVFSLAKTLKPGGTLVFKEPLGYSEKIRAIKKLMNECGLELKSGRIVDVPLMGSALESVYVK